MAEHVRVDNSEFVFWRCEYQILQCLGCDAVSFRIESHHSEDCDGDGTPIPTVKIYPRLKLKQAHEVELPENLEKIYAETVIAFNEGAPILCAVGLRALVEGVCIDQGIKSGVVTLASGKTKKQNNLEGKISGLWQKGLITEVARDALQNFRFLGNEAVHELQAPTKSELDIASKILEHLFDTVYTVEHLGNFSTLLRERRTKKSTLKSQP